MKTPPDNEPVEALLARLHPAAPPPALLARLEAARPVSPKRGRRLWIVPTLAAAAAAVALALIPTRPSAPRKSSPSPIAGHPRTLQAVGSRQVLVDLEDLGVANDPETGPVRLVLTTWIDQIAYAPSADDRPELRKAWIRSEIVPVSLPVF